MTVDCHRDMSVPMAESLLSLVRSFFDRDICARAAKPLKLGVTLLVQIDETPFTVTKENGRLDTSEGAPAKPEMSFFVPRAALDTLLAEKTQDIGEMGVAVLKLVASQEAAKRITTKVSIGPLDLLLRGYLAVLPLGGPAVMKYLASKGLTGIGKVKDAISRMRS